MEIQPLVMIFAALQVVVGLALLVFASDIMVRGSAALAENLGISPLVVGLTIVAFGTSAPELFVGVEAVVKGAPELAIGNVVGSNIANILLVVGLPAVIAPMTCAAPRLNHNMFIMILATLVFILLAFTGGGFGFFEGVALVAALGVFLLYSGLRAQQDPDAAREILEFEEEIEATKSRPALSVVMVIGGLAGLLLGANIIVDGSVIMARGFGISEAVIGLTLVALGTSLPELATAVAAARRCECDVALGNVVGSNIFNILGIIGISALFGRIPVPDSFFRVDLWVMLGSSVALLFFTLRAATVRRMGGLLLVLAYAIYVAWLAFDGLAPTQMQGAI